MSSTYTTYLSYTAATAITNNTTILLLPTRRGVFERSAAKLPSGKAYAVEEKGVYSVHLELENQQPFELFGLVRPFTKPKIIKKTES
jgi:hypothetical protein